jgi:hypothetical protein
LDFKKASILGSCLSKDYAEDLFRLLITYESISASEAASRLDLHIKTTQDFLEDLHSLDLLDREEVYEGKRPYFRYRLMVREINFRLDLSAFMTEKKVRHNSNLELKIREAKNTRARFTVSRNNDHISNVIIWMGEGRSRTERRLNLSLPQGKFLFHLPFPTAEALSIAAIMKKAGIDDVYAPEIIDIVQVLKEFNVIEE